MAKCKGGDKFDQGNWVIIDPNARTPTLLTVDLETPLGKLPNGIVGLSQGGGVADYDDATAKKLQEGGFNGFAWTMSSQEFSRKAKRVNSSILERLR